MSSMRTLLSRTGLYSFKPGGLLEAEISAYELGLSLLSAHVNQVEADMCIPTAGETRINVWEELLGIPPRQMADIHERRSLCAALLGITANSYTAVGLAQSLGASGLMAEIIEQAGNNPLQVVCMGMLGGFQTLQQTLAYARKMLPAHLEIVFDMGMLTWDAFEEAFGDWDAFDAAERSFDALDQLEI